MRVAVSGAGGRLGRALVAALADAPFTGLAGPIAWTRPDYDLDDGDAPLRLIERDRPEVVVHAAAWTDVDGALAKDRTLADQRNADAAGGWRRPAAAHGIDLIFVSTNEVFDGTRTDGRGYRRTNHRPDQCLRPEQGRWRGPGGSELRRHLRTVRDRPDGVAVRPARQRLPVEDRGRRAPARAAGEPLRVVADEYGSPTSAADVAEAIVELIGSGEVGGTYHYVNVGAVSRADWAREVLRLARVGVDIEEVLASTWVRASTPPRWGVLESSPMPSGEPMRPWTEAIADYAPFLRQLASSPVAEAPAGRTS